MKKLIIPIVAILISSCGAGSVVPAASNNCQKELDVYTSAITSWTNDITNVSKCEAVKTSLDKIVKNCSLLSAIERKKYQDDLAGFKCN